MSTRLIRLVPSVETDAERVGGAAPGRFPRTRAFSHAAVAVVGDRATVARAIVREIRRIGQDEIDAAAGAVSARHSTQSPCRTVFACGPPMTCLLCSIFILVLSFVLGFASFTPNEEAGPTRRELGAKAWLVRADAGGNASDRRGLRRPGASGCKRRPGVERDTFVSGTANVNATLLRSVPVESGILPIRGRFHAVRCR